LDLHSKPVGPETATNELRALERLHVRAWPAFETARVDGWLWRFSGGGSQRANSASTIDFSGGDPAAALDRVEVLYRAKGMPAQVQVCDASVPEGLDDLLRARGYGRGDTTLTMVKAITPMAAPPDVEIAASAGADWREVYLGAITESRRKVNARIIETIPEPRAFFACRRDGSVISTALGVADASGERAIIECMATRAEARRQGGAQAVLRALERWAGEQGARSLGLQVVAANAPALALYRGLGFVPVGSNRFWVSR
jgi:N-acetylglutamate synthase